MTMICYCVLLTSSWPGNQQRNKWLHIDHDHGHLIKDRKWLDDEIVNNAVVSSFLDCEWWHLDLKVESKGTCSKQERKDMCVNINTDDGDINYSNAVSYGVTCAKRKRRMITDGLALGDISPSRSFLSLTEAIHLEMSRSYEQFQGLARGVMGSVHSFGHFLGMASLTGLKRISTHDHHNIHKVKAVGIVG